MNFRIISIGTLAAHPLRGEREAVRPPHATSTLITGGDKDPVILVDPSLPEAPLRQRLEERSGLALEQITHVFLTSFRPDLRRSLTALDDATWWISETEREAVGRGLIEDYKRAEEADDSQVQEVLQQEIDLLRRCKTAPDHLLEGVDLFPLPGVTPGLTGLILSHPRFTVLLCGDAVPTFEHLEAGQVLAGAFDVNQAQESFVEAVEIADLLILGRDNIVVNPTRRPF